jgi:hypothetical protein
MTIEFISASEKNFIKKFLKNWVYLIEKKLTGYSRKVITGK